MTVIVSHPLAREIADIAVGDSAMTVILFHPVIRPSASLKFSSIRFRFCGGTSGRGGSELMELMGIRDGNIFVLICKKMTGAWGICGKLGIMTDTNRQNLRGVGPRFRRLAPQFPRLSRFARAARAAAFAGAGALAVLVASAPSGEALGQSAGEVCTNPPISAVAGPYEVVALHNQGTKCLPSNMRFDAENCASAGWTVGNTPSIYTCGIPLQDNVANANQAFCRLNYFARNNNYGCRVHFGTAENGGADIPDKRPNFIAVPHADETRYAARCGGGRVPHPLWDGTRTQTCVVLPDCSDARVSRADDGFHCVRTGALAAANKCLAAGWRIRTDLSADEGSSFPGSGVLCRIPGVIHKPDGTDSLAPDCRLYSTGAAQNLAGRGCAVFGLDDDGDPALPERPDNFPDDGRHRFAVGCAFPDEFRDPEWNFQGIQECVCPNNESLVGTGADRVCGCPAGTNETDSGNYCVPPGIIKSANNCVRGGWDVNVGNNVFDCVLPFWDHGGGNRSHQQCRMVADSGPNQRHGCGDFGEASGGGANIPRHTDRLGNDAFFAWRCPSGTIPDIRWNFQNVQQCIGECNLGDHAANAACFCPANSGEGSGGICECNDDYTRITGGANAGTCQVTACGFGGELTPAGTCACPAGTYQDGLGSTEVNGSRLRCRPDGILPDGVSATGTDFGATLKERCDLFGGRFEGGRCLMIEEGTAPATLPVAFGRFGDVRDCWLDRRVVVRGGGSALRCGTQCAGTDVVRGNECLQGRYDQCDQVPPFCGAARCSDTNDFVFNTAGQICDCIAPDKKTAGGVCIPPGENDINLRVAENCETRGWKVEVIGGVAACRIPFVDESGGDRETCAIDGTGEGTCGDYFSADNDGRTDFPPSAITHRFATNCQSHTRLGGHSIAEPHPQNDAGQTQCCPEGASDHDHNPATACECPSGKIVNLAGTRCLSYDLASSERTGLLNAGVPLTESLSNVLLGTEGEFEAMCERFGGVFSVRVEIDRSRQSICELPAGQSWSGAYFTNARANWPPDPGVGASLDPFTLARNCALDRRGMTGSEASLECSSRQCAVNEIVRDNRCVEGAYNQCNQAGYVTRRTSTGLSVTEFRKTACIIPGISAVGECSDPTPGTTFPGTLEPQSEICTFVVTQEYLKEECEAGGWRHHELRFGSGGVDRCIFSERPDGTATGVKLRDAVSGEDLEDEAGSYCQLGVGVDTNIRLCSDIFGSPFQNFPSLADALSTDTQRIAYNCPEGTVRGTGSQADECVGPADCSGIPNAVRNRGNPTVCSCAAGFGDPSGAETNVTECVSTLECSNGGTSSNTTNTDCNCSTADGFGRDPATKDCTIPSRSVQINSATGGEIAGSGGGLEAGEGETGELAAGSEAVFTATPEGDGFYVAFWTGDCGTGNSDATTTTGGGDSAGGVSHTCRVPAGDSALTVGVFFAAVEDCAGQNRARISATQCGVCGENYEIDSISGECAACVGGQVSESGMACGCPSGTAETREGSCVLPGVLGAADNCEGAGWDLNAARTHCVIPARNETTAGLFSECDLSGECGTLFAGDPPVFPQSSGTGDARVFVSYCAGTGERPVGANDAGQTHCCVFPQTDDDMDPATTVCKVTAESCLEQDRHAIPNSGTDGCECGPGYSGTPGTGDGCVADACLNGGSFEGRALTSSDSCDCSGANGYTGSRCDVCEAPKLRGVVTDNGVPSPACAAPSAEFCPLLVGGANVLFGGECVSECPAGYGNVNGECVACGDGFYNGTAGLNAACVSCAGITGGVADDGQGGTVGGATTCDLCVNGGTRTAGANSCDCPTGYGGSVCDVFPTTMSCGDAGAVLNVAGDGCIAGCPAGQQNDDGQCAVCGGSFYNPTAGESCKFCGAGTTGDTLNGGNTSCACDALYEKDENGTCVGNAAVNCSEAGWQLNSPDNTHCGIRSSDESPGGESPDRCALSGGPAVATADDVGCEFVFADADGDGLADFPRYDSGLDGTTARRFVFNCGANRTPAGRNDAGQTECRVTSAACRALDPNAVPNSAGDGCVCNPATHSGTPPGCSELEQCDSGKGLVSDGAGGCECPTGESATTDSGSCTATETLAAANACEAAGWSLTAGRDGCRIRTRHYSGGTETDDDDCDLAGTDAGDCGFIFADPLNLPAVAPGEDSDTDARRFVAHCENGEAPSGRNDGGQLQCCLAPAVDHDDDPDSVCEATEATCTGVDANAIVNTANRAECVCGAGFEGTPGTGDGCVAASDIPVGLLPDGVSATAPLEDADFQAHCESLGGEFRPTDRNNNNERCLFAGGSGQSSLGATAYRGVSSGDARDISVLSFVRNCMLDRRIVTGSVRSIQCDRDLHKCGDGEVVRGNVCVRGNYNQCDQVPGICGEGGICSDSTVDMFEPTSGANSICVRAPTAASFQELCASKGWTHSFRFGNAYVRCDFGAGKLWNAQTGATAQYCYLGDVDNPNDPRGSAISGFLTGDGSVYCEDIFRGNLFAGLSGEDGCGRERESTDCSQLRAGDFSRVGEFD